MNWPISASDDPEGQEPLPGGLLLFMVTVALECGHRAYVRRPARPWWGRLLRARLWTTGRQRRRLRCLLPAAPEATRTRSVASRQRTDDRVDSQQHRGLGFSRSRGPRQRRHGSSGCLRAHLAAVLAILEACRQDLRGFHLIGAGI